MFPSISSIGNSKPRNRKKQDRPPPQPSLPAIRTAIVADDVPSGPGTRQSSTRAIYKTGASVWPRCSVTEYRGPTRRIR